MKRPRPLLLLLLLLIVSAGCRPGRDPRLEPPLPLQAPFHKKRLPNVIANQTIRWLDEDRIVFIGVLPAAPSIRAGAAAAEPIRGLFLWDLSKPGPARLLLRNGFGVCVLGTDIHTQLAAKGSNFRQLVLRQPHFKPEAAAPTPEHASFRHFDPSRCRARTTPEPLRDRYWHWLAAADGYLDYGRQQARPQLNQPVYFWDATLRWRRDTGIRLDLPPSYQVERSNFDNSYLVYPAYPNSFVEEHWRKLGKLRIWRLDSGLSGTAVDIPMGPWYQRDMVMLPSKKGLVVTNNDFAADHLPRRAGAYLVSPGGAFQRLERGLVQEAVISSNGCRLAYSYQFRLDAEITIDSKPLVVVDLCGNQF
jgi:hypothetical protein